jgi:ferredoxin--NADP+ reductase
MQTTPSVAIVGSGPSGCYLAQSLRKQWPDSDITVFDQLASPFGLVRYGVAADHQNTKAVTRQFDRLFEREQVRFAGNVRIGRDLSLDELRKAFTVVAFATGLTQDRVLDIEGDSLPGVVGAGLITRKLNAHPEAVETLEPLGERITVIGTGNVAMDILRFLLKRPQDYVGSDVNDEFMNAYNQHRAKRIDVIGRSRPEEAKCDALMLRELGKIRGVAFHVDLPEHVAETAEKAVVARLAALAELDQLHAEAPVDTEVHFHFGWTPWRVTGEARATGVDCVSADDSSQSMHIVADTVISAIGFDLHSDAATMFDGYAVNLTPTPETGRFADGLYRTGWLKRGPRGTIPENRSDAKEVADEIVADFLEGKLPVTQSQSGYSALPASVRERAISFVEWQRLDAHEQALAPAGRVRQKLNTHDAMVTIARG